MSVWLGEQEHIGARVGAGKLIAGQPAQEGGVIAQALREPRLLGSPTREGEVQPRIAPARLDERVGEQVDSLLVGQAAGVKDVYLPREEPGGPVTGVKESQVDAAVPAGDPIGGDSQLREPLVAGLAR